MQGEILGQHRQENPEEREQRRRGRARVPDDGRLLTRRTIRAKAPVPGQLGGTRAATRIPVAYLVDALLHLGAARVISSVL